VYGISKAAGEHMIAYRASRYFVLRLSGLYGIAGSSGKGGNFVETMLRKAAEGQPIRVVQDQVLTPTYTVDVARAVACLLETDAYGLYHLSSEGECSWHEFAKAVFEFSGSHVDLQAVKTSDFCSSVKRPPYSVLSKAKFSSLGLASMPHWKNALHRYLDERMKNKRPWPALQFPAFIRQFRIPAFDPRCDGTPLGPFTDGT
jgi:dTDP-4-dehydrorhamnose reductase